MIDYADLARRAFQAKESALSRRAWDRFQAQLDGIKAAGSVEAYLALAPDSPNGLKGVFGHPGDRGVPSNLDQILLEAAATLPTAMDLLDQDASMTSKEAVDTAWYARGAGIDEAVDAEWQAHDWVPKGSSIVNRVIAEITEMLPYAVSLSKAA
jgi:hypothetical protein